MTKTKILSVKENREKQDNSVINDNLKDDSEDNSVINDNLKDDTEDNSVGNSDNNQGSTMLSHLREEKMKLKANLTQIAKMGQKKQAVEQNKNRKFDDIKQGDIVYVEVDGRPPNNNVRIYGEVCEIKTTRTKTGTERNYYRINSKYGKLTTGKLGVPRERIYLATNMTKEILTSREWDDATITLEDAAKIANGLNVSCRCTGDCSRSTKCSCRKANKTCTTKCHGGKGGMVVCNKLCQFIDDEEEDS